MHGIMRPTWPTCFELDQLSLTDLAHTAKLEGVVYVNFRLDYLTHLAVLVWFDSINLIFINSLPPMYKSNKVD